MPLSRLVGNMVAGLDECGRLFWTMMDFADRMFGRSARCTSAKRGRFDLRGGVL